MSLHQFSFFYHKVYTTQVLGADETKLNVISFEDRISYIKSLDNQLSAWFRLWLLIHTV